MSSTKNNKTTALARNLKAEEGVDKYFAKMGTLLIGGTTYTPTSLKAVLQAENDASHAVDSTRAQLKEQVATHRKAKAAASALRMQLRDYILGSYGSAAVEMLSDFGMVAPKPTGRKTAQSKADAAAKAKATRKAHEIIRAPKHAPAPTPPQGGPTPPSPPGQNGVSHA